MAWWRVGRVDDLWSGEMRCVHAGELRVLLVGVDGAACAYEDRCAHQGFPLSRGRLQGRLLTCAAHEWQYDVCTGEGINPKSARLRRLGVKIEDGSIWIEVAAGGANGP